MSVPALSSLKLRDVRCFPRFETEFAPGLNLIVGPNARGKTSLLEAACLLLRLQSPRTSRMADAIRHEQRSLVVDGYFASRHLQFYYAARRRKLALDGVEQSDTNAWLEVGQTVYFSMSDIELVRGGGEARRGFFDFVAAQRTASYRQTLRAYERALRSRNALLKAPSPRWREIAAFDGPLLASGTALMQWRRELTAELQPFVESAHYRISGERETLRLEYISGVGEDFALGLAAAHEEDARLRQTTVGPHRDDLRFHLNERLAHFASEGQQRTIVLALRLASALLLETHFGAAPLLLLDDIFGELDPQRRASLLGTLPAGSQKLITLTSLGWLPPEEPAQILRLE